MLLKMKKTLFLALLVMATAVVSCKRDRTIRDEAANSLPGAGVGNTVADPSAMPSPMPQTPSTAVSGGVPHYICPNNCAGSGGAAQANCPVCGTAYVHNQAFHDQPAQQTLPTPTPTPSTPAPTPEPAKNAAGVWHYTCAKGCAGGAGNPGTCSTCGGELAHNAAYHN
jgi:hypothetical protein